MAEHAVSTKGLLSTAIVKRCAADMALRSLDEHRAEFRGPERRETAIVLFSLFVNVGGEMSAAFRRQPLSLRKRLGDSVSMDSARD